MIPLACGGRDAYLTPMNTTETPLFKLRTEYVPTGRSACGHRAARFQHRSGRQGSGPAWCYRIGEDLHRGQRHRSGQPGRAWCLPRTRPWQHSFTMNSARCFRKTPLNISSATTTIISRKPMFPRPIRILRRTRPSTTTSTSSGTRLPMPCWTRRDVIIVASVSCIYGLGSPEYYARLIIPVEVGQRVSMDAIITKLVDVQYQRNVWIFTGERSGFAATCWK